MICDYEKDCTPITFDVDDDFEDCEIDFVMEDILVGGSGGTGNHDELNHRDWGDQHPIGAITDLQDELDKRKMGFAFDKMDKVADWLYEVEYDFSDYDYAYKYLKERYGEIEPNFACSAVYKNGLFGKNYDWLYSDIVDFVVHSSGNGYKSIGVAGGIPQLTKDFVESKEYDAIYKMVPFLINEGVNEYGVFVGLNVVPTNDTKQGEPFSTITTGTNPDLTSKPVCSMMLPKIVLDKCKTANEAISLISDSLNVYCPHSPNFSQEMHLFVGDSTKQYIVEFINNTTNIIDVTNSYPWMTNFYRTDAEFNDDGTVIWQSLTDHATSVKRNDIIAEHFGDIESLADMQNLMNNLLKYTHTYTTPYDWVDEFVYNYGEESFGDLTLELAETDPTAFDDVINYYVDKYEHRDRTEPITWQSEHSCVYDISNQKLYVVVQEDGIQHEMHFDVECATKHYVDEQIDIVEGEINEVAEDVSDLADALQAEAETRATADTQLGGRIDALGQALETEAETRESADTQLQSNINAEAQTRQSADTQLQGNIDTEASARQSADQTLQSNIISEAQARQQADNVLADSISDEADARQSADENLQEQIDAIVSASDVVDIVGTYQELLEYDTSHLEPNDIIKVLADETHDDARSYYRWLNNQWNYIGSEAISYTKAEEDALLNGKVDKVTGKQLSTNDYTNADKALVGTITSKQDKDTNAVEGNLAEFDDDGNTVDSGYKVQRGTTIELITELNDQSTDSQIPTAKTVYDALQESGTKIFIVTAVWDEETENYTLDKTYNEIYEAYSQGNIIKLYTGFGTEYLVEEVYYDEEEPTYGYIEFVRIGSFSDDEGGISEIISEIISIMYDNTVTYEGGTFDVTAIKENINNLQEDVDDLETGKVDKSSQTSETWTFTLADSTTVTKKVVLSNA